MDENFTSSFVPLHYCKSRSRVCMVLGLSNTWIAGSNLVPCMDARSCFSVQVETLRWTDPPSKPVILTIHSFRINSESAPSYHGVEFSVYERLTGGTNQRGLPWPHRLGVVRKFHKSPLKRPLLMNSKIEYAGQIFGIDQNT
jgi:hypothetical protein